MLYNPFKNLKKREWVILVLSIIIVSVSLLVAPNTDPISFAASIVGAVALIFVARGDVWGEILTFVFAALYLIVSIKFRYWGEAITYMGMTAPMSVLSIISWLKNPYKKGKNEVKIHRLSKRQKVLLVVLTVLITVIFHFVLKAFNTPNLLFSTISVATSFAACYLTFYRSSYYAVAYALNDIVLIVLWILASLEDSAYLSMVMCFVMFLVNDINGFVSWKLREKEQMTGK